MRWLDNPFRGQGLTGQNWAPVVAEPVEAQALFARCPVARETPLIERRDIAGEIGVANLFIKDERDRLGLGSFKALGGAYAVARLLQAKMADRLGRPVAMEEVTGRAHPDLAAAITVCCATDGNHGRSVAWGAQNFGCRCVIFIHATV